MYLLQENLLFKAFQKQTKTIEDHGQKQVEALEKLNSEETKPIKDTSNNQSRVTIVFKDLINKRKELMNDLYDSVDYNNLNFKSVGPTKDVSLYEYMDSKELFDAIRSRITFTEALNKQNEFLNKVNDVKIREKNLQQKDVIDNVEARLKCYQMQITMLSKMRLREKDLKY